MFSAQPNKKIIFADPEKCKKFGKKEEAEWIVWHTGGFSSECSNKSSITKFGNSIPKFWIFQGHFRCAAPQI